MRALDRALDRIDNRASVESDAFADAFAFAAHPATCQCGPLVPHAAYEKRKRTIVDTRIDTREKKTKKTKTTGPSFGVVFTRRLRRLAASLAPLAAWCLVVDLMYARGYAPTRTFFSRRSQGQTRAIRSRSELCLGFAEFAQTVAFATASVTSHAVFGVPRAVAAASTTPSAPTTRRFSRRRRFSVDVTMTIRKTRMLSIPTPTNPLSDIDTLVFDIVPNDTPEFWPSASTSPEVLATVSRVVFSVLLARSVRARDARRVRRRFSLRRVLHGVPRVFRKVAPVGRDHRHEPGGGETNARLRATNAPAADSENTRKQNASSVVVDVGALAQTATAATFVGPAVFPGLEPFTAAKVLMWGVLVSAVWQSSARVP